MSRRQRNDNGDEPSSGRQPRQYGFACINCKARKVKCSGEQPQCRACHRSGARCVWQARSSAASGKTERQLQDANARIRELEAALQAANANANAIATPSAALENQELQGSANTGTPTVAGGTPASAPSASSPTAASTYPPTGPSLWFQVGLGEDGAVTYNGPTSRFHAEPLEDGDSTGSQGNQQNTCSGSNRALHVDTLRLQYEMLHTTWEPLVSPKPSFESLGVDGNMCVALLDIYWNWLQPLHNCVYRPRELLM